MKLFRTHQKLLTVPVLYTLWVFLFALLKKSLTRSCGSVPRFLTILLVGVFFSVPLVTHADWGLSGIIIAIVGFLLYITAGLFDSAISYFVLQMGGLITGTGSTGIGIGVSINVIWTIVRDLVNLTFIFGLVYVGFKTILDAGTDTKKLLSSIIIGALLVNFSLFISKVVIDVSNVTASEIYKQMGIGTDTRTGSNRSDLSVSRAFMTQMGIMKLVAPDQSTQAKLVAQTAGGSIGTTDGYLAFVVGASLFILVASFVFAVGAFLLAIRFGVLVILMMLSPIAFAASVFPVFKGWSDKWWHSLFSQAFFAPAYIFMLYVTLKVAEGYAMRMGGFDKIFIGEGFIAGNFGTAIFFTLTIVIMVSSLILAKQMGAYGASRALAVGKNLRGRAQSLVGRYTIGRAAQLGAYTNAQLEQRKGGRVFKGLVSAASLGTFTERTRRAVFEAGKTSKFGGSYSVADDIKFRTERDKTTTIYNDIQNGEKATARAKKTPTAPVSADDEKLIIALGKAISRRSTKDLEEMQVSLLSNENIAVHITGEQMSNIRKNENGKFSVADIAKIADARTKALQEAADRDPMVGLGMVQGPQTLAGRGENDLRRMPVEEVLAYRNLAGGYPMAPYITPRMIEYIAQEGASIAEITALRTAVQAELDARVALPGDPYRAKFAQWVHGNNTYGPGFGLLRI